MLTHTFDVGIATKFGVPVAIVLNHIAFWIQKNKANEKHFHDGRFWTYNSIKAFQILFPYWTFKQMRAVLDKLKETGLIMTGNYNQKGYDQTQWYALSDEGLKLYNILPSKDEPVDNITPICPKRQMDMPKTANAFGQKGKPIPDIKTDNKSSYVLRKDKTVDNSKKHDWATPKPSPFSDPTKQSTSFKPETEPFIPNPEAMEEAMRKLPRHMRPKRYRNAETGVHNAST